MSQQLPPAGSPLFLERLSCALGHLTIHCLGSRSRFCSVPALHSKPQLGFSKPVSGPLRNSFSPPPTSRHPKAHIQLPISPLPPTPLCILPTRPEKIASSLFFIMLEIESRALCTLDIECIIVLYFCFFETGFLYVTALAVPTLALQTRLA